MFLRIAVVLYFEIYLPARTVRLQGVKSQNRVLRMEVGRIARREETLPLRRHKVHATGHNSETRPVSPKPREGESLDEARARYRKTMRSVIPRELPNVLQLQGFHS